MIKVLYGNLKYQNKFDFLILPFKYLYVLYTLPTLFFIFMLAIRSGGVFGNPLNEEFGDIKAIVFRLSVLILSFALWISIFMIIEDLMK